MKKTWKKSLAGLCVAAMTVSSLNVGPAVLETEAKVINSDWVTTKEGLKVQVSVRYAGDTDYGVLVGDIKNLFDGDTSTTVTYRESLSSYANDNIAQGDYIQLTFEDEIDLAKVAFKSPVQPSGDWFATAELEYTTKENAEWQSLKSFTEGSSTYEYADDVVEVKSVRLRNTGADKKKWLQISEIEITQAGYMEVKTAPTKTVYKIGEELNTEGLVLYICDKTGSESEVTTGFTVKEDTFDSSTSGKKSVTVQYEDYEASFDVNVYQAGEKYPSAGLTITASNQQTGNESGEIENAFDGNESTYWHSNYTDSNITSWWSDKTQCADYLWVEMQFEEPTVVDAVNYTPRNSDSNGYIYGYKIEGTADGTNWYTLTEGNWGTAESRRAGERTAAFLPTELKAVRLRATATYGSDNNTYASASEISVRTASEESVTKNAFFLGGSLRMDYQDEVGYTKTGLRFGYQIPETFLNDSMEITTWDWMYSKESESAMTKQNIENPKYITNADGTRTTNLLVGGTGVDTAIPSDSYGTTLYSQIMVTYSNGTDSMTVYSPVATRTVRDVATALKNKYQDDTTNEQFQYCAGILDAMQSAE